MNGGDSEEKKWTMKEKESMTDAKKAWSKELEGAEEEEWYHKEDKLSLTFGN